MKTQLALLVGIVLIASSACRSGGASIPYGLVGQAGVVTLVNLHPDEKRAKMYSTNYQKGSLLPRCTEVMLVSLNGRQLTFTVTETGATYAYILQRKQIMEPIEQHLDRRFGTSCPEVSGMSEVDQKGIANGEVYVGMTKQGVLYAIGYPPSHETASTDLDRWKYWIHRFNTMIVHFEGDTVVEIQN